MSRPNIHDGDFDAVRNDAVAKGTCIVLDKEDNLLYAGPVDRVPGGVADRTVLLNPADFEVLQGYVQKRRH